MKRLKLVIDEYYKASKLIKEMKLTWGYFLGGAIGVIILSFFYWISGFFGGWIFEKLSGIFKIQEHIFIIRWIIVFIVRSIMIGIYYFFFKAILLTLLAPFFSYISEKVETELYGTKYSFTFKENLGFVLRGIKIAGKSFFKEIIATVVVILLSFIPIVNFVVPILIFIIQSYFISYNFVDYTLERHNYSEKESIEFMKENRLAFTFGGGIFTFIYFIPLVGIVIAPLLAIVALTSSTLKIIKRDY
ncbi:EI24 domain-containing protein [uncultured Cetobacterium sp.]|uniref:EI24 domain-containing protein n=1 Tax=uncultured Cetobacterium sp. TaxID=527638 RepID=UPI00263447EB|nr:EI24 domain-containing protein [uncultured Cetobacterium sp.]